MNKIEIPENDKQLILKLICNDIINSDKSNDLECIKKLIINKEIKYYLIRLKVFSGHIFINEETYESGIIDIEMYINPYTNYNDNKLYMYSQQIDLCFSSDINLKIFKLIDKLIKLKNEKDLKILQCTAVCNKLIKSGFRRPFNITEDVICQF